MKSLFVARLLLIDCGKASKRTRGALTGGIFEGAFPPYQWFPG
jgi:hypothetical protein